MLGEVPLAEATAPKELTTILSWADAIRKGHLAVRANADTGPDAAAARRLGAEGIGLCRTEHMFLAEDRLPIVRRMILASDPAAIHDALEELRVAQRADFLEILEAMDGLPVTVRLLDPPLHEFLPSTEELAVKEAAEGLSDEERALLARGAVVARGEPDARDARRAPRRRAARPLRDAGARADGGRRRAARGAAADPIVEVMIPLTVSRAELALARALGGARHRRDRARRRSVAG